MRRLLQGGASSLPLRVKNPNSRVRRSTREVIFDGQRGSFYASSCCRAANAHGLLTKNCPLTISENDGGFAPRSAHTQLPTKGSASDWKTTNGSSKMSPRSLFRRSVAPIVAAFALTALSAVSAVAQDKKPNILVIMGDDIGMWNIGAYSRGMMAGTDAEPRQARQGRHAVHRLLRRGKLHGGSRQLHHRRAADPHRHDHGRPGRRLDRPAGRGGDHRDGLEVDGLRHRPVRQEPSRRQERVPADRPRLRRVLRLPLSPRRDGRPGASQLSAEPAERRRPAQHGP